MGSGEAKELICMTNRCELSGGELRVGESVQGIGEQRGGNGTTVVV